MTNRIFLFFLFAAGLVFTTGCDDDDDGGIFNDSPATFTMTIENVSTAGLINTDRAMGTIPLSPPAFAVYDDDQSNPMFTPGELGDSSIALIAEDGFAASMVEKLMNDPNVKVSGVETSPGGPDNGPALFAGESVSITFVAEPGDRVQIATMFVQSNDWFYAFDDGGFDLFTLGEPKDGDITDELVIYDAGTEEDTAPGTGPTELPGPVQKPVQPADATNFGTDESEPIQEARDRFPNFTIPANSTGIRVTLTSVR